MARFVPLAFIAAALVPTQVLSSTPGATVQQRMASDAALGNPFVAHVVVALCDNRYQGIVPVPFHLGNGDDPASNLYWGALYGVRTYFARHEKWASTAVSDPTDARILDRVAFRATLQRDGQSVEAYVIADAWRGREIEAATARFLEFVGGSAALRLDVGTGAARRSIMAGGGSHVVAYVGHNGLMDFAAPALSEPVTSAAPRSSIVLACESRSHFSELLSLKTSHSLLTTTGLMAPEAYTLEAAIRSWFEDESTESTHEAAAGAYARFQNARLDWTRRLFVTEP
ncbi:MAG: hypothetical protein AAFM91_03340 [Pseudomonadota bacterium]